MAHTCLDFRNENNGKFVLGVVFFLQTNFDFLTSVFDEAFYIIQKVLLILARN